MNKRTVGYRICSVRDCKSTSRKLNCHFFHFPKDAERLRQWAIACGREDLLEKTPENIYSTNRVCSDHFEDRMYTNNLKNRLLPLAQPTLNLGQNLENNQNNKNCAHVKTNTSSGIRQTTHSLEEEESLQLSADHDVRAEHNYVGLEPITPNFLQPSIVVSSTNNSSMTDPTTAVTAGPSGVGDHREVKLLPSQNLHKYIQTTYDLSAHTRRKLKVQKENRILKKENRILKKKYAGLHEIIKEMADVTEHQFLKACEKFLTPKVELFVREQVLSGKKEVRGRRYSLEFKQLCLNLYFKGARAYRTLSSIFYLPSRMTLNRMTINVSITSGINQNVFNLMAVKFATMQESAKICVVCFDEMSLKCYMYYNTKADEVIGFHDSSNEKQFQPAKFACVFIARSIFGDWKQPLAYELLNTACSTAVLKQLLTQCIFELQNIGLTVAAVVCNMGPKNKQLANELGITPITPYFTLNDRKIFFLFDVPHLIKATRNIFLNYTFMFGQFFAKMEYVRQFYEFDKIMQFRLAPKLTNSHVNPSPAEKRKTRLAPQLLSQSVVAGISTYMHFGKLSTEAVGTVTFIDKMDKLFDMLNSTAKYTGKKLHAHVFEGNEFQTAFLKECLEFFDLLLIVNRNGQNITNHIKFIHGWKVTISGVLQLWECLKEKGFDSVQTRRLNQDPIENFFGKIRLEEKNCLNPPVVAFIRAFKKLLFQNFFNTGNENCEDDFDNILLDLNRLNEDEIKEIGEESEGGLFDTFTPDDVDYQKLNLVEKNSIRYICGFLIRKCLRKHSCTVCEGYSIDHVEFEDSTIFCFFKAYQNKNSFFRNMPHNNFIFYVCSLEAIFNEHFQNIVLEKNVIQKLLAEAELTTFKHPCSSFSHLYLKKLFFRMRLYYTLKFINYNFWSSKNPNKMIIWRHE